MLEDIISVSQININNYLFDYCFEIMLPDYSLVRNHLMGTVIEKKSVTKSVIKGNW
jgi:hypothetical protein